jgi:hypothetical protein
MHASPAPPSTPTASSTSPSSNNKRERDGHELLQLDSERSGKANNSKFPTAQISHTANPTTIASTCIPCARRWAAVTRFEPRSGPRCGTPCRTHRDSFPAQHAPLATRHNSIVRQFLCRQFRRANAFCCDSPHRELIACELLTLFLCCYQSPGDNLEHCSTWNACQVPRGIIFAASLGG